MKRKQLLLTAMMFSTSMVAAELPINNLLAESPEDRQEINLLIEQIKSNIAEKKSFFYDKSPNFKGLSLGVNAGDVAKLAIIKTGKVNNDYIINKLSHKDLEKLQKELSSMTANVFNYKRRKNLDYTKNTINKALDAKSIKNIFRSSAKSSAKNTLKPIYSPLITTTIGPNIEIDLNNSISLKSNLSRAKSKPFIDLDSFATIINHDTQVGNDNVSLGIGLGINYQKNNDFSKYNYLSIRPTDHFHIEAFKHFNNKKNINNNAEFLVVNSGQDRGQWFAPKLIVEPSTHYVDTRYNSSLNNVKKIVYYGPEDHLMFVYRTKITNIINSISLITGPTITSKQFTINVFNKLWISLNLNLFIKFIINPFYIFSSVKQFIAINDNDKTAHYKETKLPLAFDCDFSINNLLVKLI